MRYIVTKEEVKEKMARERIVKDYRYCIFKCPFSKEIDGKQVCIVEKCPKNNVVYEFKEK